MATTVRQPASVPLTPDFISTNSDRLASCAETYPEERRMPDARLHSVSRVANYNPNGSSQFLRDARSRRTPIRLEFEDGSIIPAAILEEFDIASLQIVLIPMGQKWVVNRSALKKISKSKPGGAL
jgi:hypothetical protein